MQENKRVSRRAILKSMGSASALVALSPLVNTALANKILVGVTPDYQRVLDEVCELILPKTDTPGALDLKVPEFIHLMVQQFYLPQEQMELIARFAEFDKQSQKLMKKPFLPLAKKQKIQVLQAMAELEQASIFAEIKALTVLGYYTSKEGAKQLRYVPVPGKYQPCVEMTPTTKAAQIAPIG